jgi:acetyl esterase/lipase
MTSAAVRSGAGLKVRRATSAYTHVMLIAATMAVLLAHAGATQIDLPYGPLPQQRLDLHLPAAPPTATVMFIHGGSLSESGERRSSPIYTGVCPTLAARGVACATIDYRLWPADVWPAMAEDAARAVAWLRTTIARHGGDPGRVFLFGHSSGGHLAAVLAANPRFLAAHDLKPSELAGIIAMGCVLSPTEEVLARRSLESLRERSRPAGDLYPTVDAWLDADPSRFLGPHVPPVLVLLAEGERFFPATLEQGAKFVRRLLEMKRPADLVIVPGRHVSSISEFAKPGSPALAAVLAFLAEPARIPGRP